MCTNTLTSRKWKIVFVFEQYTEVFHDTHAHTKPQTEYGFPMTSSSLRGEREPSLATGSLVSGRHHGVPEGGQGALTPQTRTTPPRCCLPVPARSSEAASIPFSLTTGWQWLTLSHEVSVMKSEVSREGRAQKTPLARRSMLKYRVRFQLSLVKPTITFELTEKWEDSWLLPSQ